MMIEKKKLSIRQNLVWNTIGCSIYQGCQWLITILVVVFSDDYSNSGILAYAMAMGNILYPLATYNMRTFQVSDTENEYSQSEYVAFRIITVIMGLVIMLVYLNLVSNSSAAIVATICWFLFKADESFCSVLYGVCQKEERMDFIGLSQALRGIFLVLAFSIVLLGTDDINIAIIAMSIGCIAITCLYDWRMAGHLCRIKPSISAKRAASLLIKCLPAVISLVAYGAVVSFARQSCLNCFGENALGVYAAVATPTVIVQVAASYLYSPFLAPLSEKWHAGSKGEALKTILKVLIGICFIFAALICLAIPLGPSLLLLLYGTSIEGYVYLLIPALFATATSALMGFCTDLLILTRNMIGALVSNVLALVTCVLISKLLMSSAGLASVNYVIIVSFATGIICASICFFLHYKADSR